MKTTNWDDLGFSVIFEPNEYYTDFKVYKITAWSMNNSTRYYENKNKQRTHIENADVFMSGHIKWDGCSNIKFDEQDRCMLHFCGKKDAMKIGELMERLYDEGSKYIEHIDRSIYE